MAGTLGALVLAHVHDHQHERAVGVEVEPLARMLGEHARRVRSIRLAELDPPVERVLHARIARIGQDRSMAERARPELRAALEPADHLPGRDVRRDGLGLDGSIGDAVACRACA